MGAAERDSGGAVRVPVPPLGSYESGQRFHRLLLLFLRDLKEAGEPVGRHQFLLAGVVELHQPASPWTDGTARQQPRCGSCRTPYPCRTVLGVAVAAGLPIAWRSPVEVVPALRDAGLEPRAGGEVTAGTVFWQLGWGARRVADGSWEIGIELDRGEVEIRTVADDAEMAQYLAGQAGLAGPFPYGWAEDAAEVAAVRPAAYEQAARWRETARLPYLDGHREYGATRVDGAAG